MKVLVVGLNPSKKHGDSPSLKTLYKWLTYLDLPVVSFTNLYEGYDIDTSKTQGQFIKSISKEYDKVLALGSIVSNCLRVLDVDHFRLPHPSGLNRQLNDEKFVHDQLEACKNYLKGP